MTASAYRSPTPRTEPSSDAQLDRLRTLLMGKDYAELLALKAQVTNAHSYSEQLAPVIAEALALRNQQDGALTDVLMPTVEQALTRSIENDPSHLANALYPVMGPAIRKSINEALAQTLETFNQLLEQSVSPRSLRWRFDAWRTGRSYSEVVLSRTLVYQVEQVFLIHRETGLLLQHVMSEQAITKDPDMVSGMLTAIQDFVHDSFGADSDDSLNNMRLGDLTVMVEQGPYAVVAAVIHGNPPAALRTRLKAAQEDVHRQMRQALKGFEGDSEPFASIRPLLENCLTSQVQEQPRGKPWLAWLVLAGLLAGLGWWAYQHYRQQQLWQQDLQRLQAEPGLMVVASERTAEGYRISGLRDPLAREPASVLHAGGGATAGVEMDFRPYLSMETDMITQRIRHMLQPPDSVELQFEKGQLQVAGHATTDWQQRLLTTWSLIPGVDALDSSGLQVFDPEAERRRQAEQAAEQARLQAEQVRLQQVQALQARIAELARQIDDAYQLFAPGDAALDATAEDSVRQVATTLLDLLKAVRENGQMLQVQVNGQADRVGSEETNMILARERAESVRAALINQGVPAAVVVAGGIGAGGRDERSVRYKVSVY